MLFLRFLLLLVAIGLLCWGAGMLVHDVVLALELDRFLRREKAQPSTELEQAAGEAGERGPEAVPEPGASCGRRCHRVVDVLAE